MGGPFSYDILPSPRLPRVESALARPPAAENAWLAGGLYLVLVKARCGERDDVCKYSLKLT